MRIAKLGILGLLLAIPVFHFASNNQQKEENHGPMFYAAEYSSNFTAEPLYNTQNNLTFNSMNMSSVYRDYRGDSVKVAVIDSGLNYDHEDFKLNGTRKFKNASGSFEYTDKWYYYSFSNYPTHLSDSIGHGTNVASVIASQINGVGCAGIAPNVELYVYKVTNSNNGYEWGAIQNALLYCIQEGVDVINMSFQAYEHDVTYNGSTMPASSGCSTILSYYLNQCYNAGITLVAAAGNYNTSEPSYPASNDHVISVGSLARSSTTSKAGFSNTHAIDLVAPGYVHVADKGTTSSYKETQGTSFSAPIVTAAIALYKQKYPSATPSQIESALYASCDAISGNPGWAGNGRLNLANFLGYSEPTDGVTSITLNNVTDNALTLRVGDTFDIDYTVNGVGSFSQDVVFEALMDEGVLSVDENGRITALAEGEDYVTITSEDNPNVYESIDVTVEAAPAPKTLTSISISGQKTAFNVGDTFSFGGTVTAHYSDSSSENVTGSATFIGYDMSTAGNQTVTVSYTYGGVERTTSYQITVSPSGSSSTYNETFDYSDLTTWNITDYSSENGYLLCPNSTNQSIATFTGIFEEKVITSNIVITINCATYGSGTDPSTDTFKLYKDASCTSLVTSSQTGTLPTSKNYTDVVYTVTNANAVANFVDDLAIKITKPGKQIRLKSITIQFSWQQAAATNKLDSISLNTTNVKTKFDIGDAFSYTGLVVTAHYTIDSDKTVTPTSVSTPDLTILGNKTVTVSYTEGNVTKESSYQITVEEGVLDSISVSGYTTSYGKNTTFSFDGTCTATLTNGYQMTVTPTSVSTPNMSTAGNKTITVSYTYNGVTKTTTYDITVTEYRTVMEVSYSLIGIVSYTSGSEVISVNTLSTSTSGYTLIENGPDSSHKAIRLGSGSNIGTLTITSTTSNIYKVVVNARIYSSDSSVTLTIGGTSNTLTSSYADYTKEYQTATNSVSIATTTSKKRAWISTVTVYTKSEQDIGQTEDCVGLESFISTYMHMDYTDNLGYCKDSEHHYYSTAKTAFNSLNEHQRALFTKNTAYSLEWVRLSAWASINGDSLDSNNQLGSNSINKISIISNNNYIPIVMVALVLGLTTSLVAIYHFKKKKEQ